VNEVNQDFSWDKVLKAPEEAAPQGPGSSNDGSPQPFLPSSGGAAATAPWGAPPSPTHEPVQPLLELAQESTEGEQYIPAAIPKHLVEPQVEKDRYAIEGETGPFHGDAARALDTVHIDEILHLAVERKASDIHLTAGLPPMVRVDGELVPLNYVTMKPEHTRRMVYECLSDDHIQKFEQTHELDFGYAVKGLARFRFNSYMQRGSVAAALRMIPNSIPTFEQLRLPGVVREVAKRHSGLVLVTGPTGSGKSTTIAAMIDDINSTRPSHIMTIEDPIEYVHKHKRCMVNQRELHSDTYSFHNALRAVLREDPDIILVGEMRDLETIEAALTLAETGHLVFGTLHTRNAPSTIDRVVDVFPADQQDQIRVLMGNTLEAVVSQQLLPKLGGGRCASLEIMLGVPAVKNLIREGKTHQMYSVIETSSSLGMVTMDRSLAELYRQGYVSFEECLQRSVDKETFSRLAKGAA
jgi:twitching motility protein PilT